MGKDQDENDSGSEEQLPAVIEEKPSLVEWFESFLPFRLPRIPLPQTAKNLDKAVARIVDAGGENAATRIASSTQKQAVIGIGSSAYLKKGYELATASLSVDNDKRAVDYFFNQAKIEQINREKIIKIAAEDLIENEPIKDAETAIEDDWLNTFSKIAADKSDEDIQRLWGYILAGEIRSPGSVRLRTLASLAMFDGDDAQFACDFLRNTVDKKWALHSFYNEGSQYSALLRAREIGLVAEASQMTFGWEKDKTAHTRIGSRGLKITAFETYDTQHPVILLTSLGQTISRLIGNADADETFIKQLLEIFKSPYLVVSLIDFAKGHNNDTSKILCESVVWDGPKQQADAQG